MTGHLGPPRPPGPPPGPGAPAAPEPSYPERARTLVHLGRAGTLSTLSARHPGHPFGSVMPYALDGEGRPLFLVSEMAMHTRNLRADPRASLLVTEGSGGEDPLGRGRVTLMGTVRPIPGEAAAGARALYLARHPSAAYWVDFDDFGFHRLDVADVYFVGGFAAMDWIDGRDYAAARPDPLAEAAAHILEHVNRDHGDALVTLARGLARAEADEATMLAVDRLGFKLRIRTSERLSSVRIPFPREVRTPEEARMALIEMLGRLRAAP